MRKLGLLFVLLAMFAVAVSAPLAQEELPEFIQDLRTECEVDLSGMEFELWHLGDLSGPYGPITQPVVAGFDDAAAYFNERGGACGATIVLPDPTSIDTGGDLEQAQIIYDRVAAENPRLLVLYGSPDAELLREQLAEDQIPVVISAGSVPGLYGEDGNTPGWIFATNPLYVDQFGQFCQYAAENIEEPVIGYISWPSAFGRAAFTPEAVAYCESLGVDVIDEPSFFIPGDDISGNVQTLVDEGANILYTNTLATGPAAIAATVTNLGLNDQVQLAGVNWSLDTSVGLLGLQSIAPNQLPSVNGWVGSMPFAWWTERDNPGIAWTIEQADANGRDVSTRNIAYILGVTTIDIYIELIIQTANRVGADFTGADVYETLETLDYNTLGILPVKFTDDDGNAIRDVELNRMAVLTYLGQDGGAVSLPDNPPVLAELPDGRQIPIPIVVGLEDFRATPDLRPGGADDPMMMEDE